MKATAAETGLGQFFSDDVAHKVIVDDLLVAPGSVKKAAVAGYIDGPGTTGGVTLYVFRDLVGEMPNQETV